MSWKVMPLALSCVACLGLRVAWAAEPSPPLPPPLPQYEVPSPPQHEVPSPPPQLEAPSPPPQYEVPSPPPQLEAPSPPPQLDAPSPPQYNAAPLRPWLPPVDSRAAELAGRGHRKKVAGAVLMGVGAGLSVLGIALALDVAVNRQISCAGHEEHAVCTPSPALTELNSGYVAVSVGQLMMLVGIPVYVVGSVQAAKARRWSGQLALQPLFGHAGAGALAAYHLRF